MSNTYVMVSNAEASSIGENVAVRAQSSTVNLLDSSPLPAGSPINSIIRKWPRQSSGQVRVRVGAGAGTFTLTLTASDIILGTLPRPVALSITGPGDYLWPPGRRSLATALSRVSGPTPGGTVAVDLLKDDGKIAGDAAAAGTVLGMTKPGSVTPPGGQLQLITSGPALCTCSGGWVMGDALVCAAAGALRKLAPMETGVDQVATADADAADGDTSCPVTVGLVAV